MKELERDREGTDTDDERSLFTEHVAHICVLTYICLFCVTWSFLQNQSANHLHCQHVAFIRKISLFKLQLFWLNYIYLIAKDNRYLFMDNFE